MKFKKGAFYLKIYELGIAGTQFMNPYTKRLWDLNPERLKIKGYFKGQFPEHFGKIKGYRTRNDYYWLSLISDTECIECI